MENLEGASESRAPDDPANGPGWIRRRAKLFEAGSYPDKGVEIGPERLRQLSRAFDAPVPVLIEHAESPLDLGYLTEVEALGSELFGTIALTPLADSLLRQCDAASLSIGLSPELDHIREVSLVRNPRVASARLYSDGPRFEREIAWTPPVEAVDWQRKYHRLRREHADQEASRKVSTYVAEGRLTPAQAPIAHAMLLSDDTVEFDGSSLPLAQLLASFIERQPAHGLFRERAPAADPDYSKHLMMPEEVAFYERHFPGVSLDEIAKRRK